MAHIKQLSLLEEPAFKALQDFYADRGHALNMENMFAADASRFSKFSNILETGEGELLFDYSKNIINEEGLGLLLNLARSRHVEEFRDATFAGSKINLTEFRAVLHHACRNRSNTPISNDGADVMPDVNQVLTRMKIFTKQVRSGEWKGYSGKPINDVVNIGIGGSHLGPQMVSEALKPYNRNGPKIHWISNVDGAHVEETLETLNPETTLFIISSKSFTTQETLVNANAAKLWLTENVKDATSAIRRHFVAVTTKAAEQYVADFGIAPEYLFEYWNWVNSQFSQWSSGGLPVALGIGFDKFEELLEGAHFMDNHFVSAPLEENIPVIHALLGIWYHNFFGASSYAILSYDNHLKYFCEFFPSIEMECNGKMVTRDGKPVKYITCPIVWGRPGTDMQHTMMQIIMQGTRMVPYDFLVPIKSHSSLQGGLHQKIMLASFVSQSEGLMRSKGPEEVREEMMKNGKSNEEIETILLHAVFEGNKPSTSIIFPKLTPYMLGILMALYEHKIFIQGAIWDINSYDFFGCTRGKELLKIFNLN